MAKIQIPFREDMAIKSIIGRKTGTSRNTRYGDPGDEFELKGVEFRLKKVTKQYLNTIASARYSEEGFDSPQEFMDIWVELHPRAGWEPHKRVWFHEYERITDLSTMPDEFLQSLEKYQEGRE